MSPSANTNGPTLSSEVDGVMANGNDEAILQRWEKRLGALPSLALPTDYLRPCELDGISRTLTYLLDVSAGEKR
jgi:hypothetical protein